MKLAHDSRLKLQSITDSCTQEPLVQPQLLIASSPKKKKKKYNKLFCKVNCYTVFIIKM